jgi:hypothetical protein
LVIWGQILLFLAAGLAGCFIPPRGSGENFDWAWQACIIMKKDFAEAAKDWRWNFFCHPTSVQ